MPHSTNNSTSTQAKMSRPSSTSTASGAAAFPKQAGATLLSPELVEEQLSPAHSQFSFASTPQSVQDAERDELTQMRPVTRGTPGDKIGHRSTNSRSRQQFFDDSFAYKEGTASTARDRVTKDAPIVAELRTNVIIKDEYTLVTDLSHHLSTRYQRPETSIMITVNHSACLLLGGSFEPTYILTINALPLQLQPTLNKRNAALISTFMAESIGVMPDRGIIKFIPIAEESLAMNGTTVLGDIERLERQHAEENGTSTIKRAMTKSSRKSAVSKAKSSIQLSRNSSKANTGGSVVIATAIPSDGPLDSGVAIDEKDFGDSAPLKPIDNKKTERKFSVRSHSNGHRVSSHITAGNDSNPPLQKRKSFFDKFRR